MKKKHKEEWQSILLDKTHLRIFAFNVEAFVSKKAQDLINKIMFNNDVLLIVDESSRIKRPGAKRTKFITKMASWQNIVAY
jgi:hypothetical protein